MRRKGGATVRSKQDTIQNPAARFVAPLTDADLPRMTGREHGGAPRVLHSHGESAERMHRRSRAHYQGGPTMPYLGEGGGWHPAVHGRKD